MTSRRIAEAAEVLFARYGYAAVSMRQIAAKADIVAAALYNHYPTKQDILFHLMKAHMEDLLRSWAAYEKGEGPVARIEAFVKFHIRYHQKRSDAVFIAYMELRNLEPENFQEIEHLRHNYEAELEAILKAGVDRGVFEIADIRITIMALIALLTGVTNWFREGGRLSVLEVETIYLEMVMRMVSAAKRE